MSENETSWGIDPVPERLRVLGGFDLALLWGNLGVSLLVVVAGAILVPALSLPSAFVAIAVGRYEPRSPSGARISVIEGTRA